MYPNTARSGDDDVCRRVSGVRRQLGQEHRTLSFSQLAVRGPLHSYLPCWLVQQDQHARRTSRLPLLRLAYVTNATATTTTTTTGMFAFWSSKSHDSETWIYAR